MKGMTSDCVCYYCMLYETLCFIELVTKCACTFWRTNLLGV